MAHKASLSTRRKLRKEQKRVQKTAKLGSGARFKAVVKSAKAGGAKNPEAVAAAVGRKKLGKTRFQSLAKKGKKK